MDFGIDFRSIVEWSWRGLAGVLEPMLASKSSKVEQAIRFVIVFLLIFDGFVIDFGNMLASTLEGRGAPNHWKAIGFCMLLVIWASLTTNSYMIDFLNDLAFNLKPKTFQNWSQDASQIDQKCIENCCCCCIVF